jgi:TctA family transporter
LRGHHEDRSGAAVARRYAPQLGRHRAGVDADTLIGLVPGAGGLVPSLVSCGVERRVFKHPEEFGRGAIAGVAGPESANKRIVDVRVPRY